MFVTQDHNFIVVPFREDLLAVMPHAKSFDYGGVKHLLLPNGPDEAKVARNLGVPVPSPIMTRYGWPGKDAPWDIQKITSALLVESKRAFNLNEMGTGKTRSSIWASDYLMTQHRTGPTLISAPLSTLNRVWEVELFEVLPQARVRVLHGSKAKRLRLLQEDADWFIVNHHGVEIILDELLARGFGQFIIDELSVFRNKSSSLWKSHNPLVCSPIKYSWGLTGSPTPKAPTDAWSQVRMIQPGNVPKTMTRFKDLTMRQVTSFKWTARPEATDIVHRAMQPAVRFTLDDVTELPEVIFENREIKLEPDAAKAYKMLFDKMLMLTNGGQTITAVNEGVLTNKLLQVACGYIYTDKGKVYELPNGPRLDATLEYCEGTSRKVIVFVPYVHALQGVSKFLIDKGQSVAVVHGGTARGARDRAFRRFQEEDEPHTLVAHPACMAHGLTLTAANTIVWYGAPNNLDTYDQANHRMQRPSQKSKMRIVHLFGTPVEKACYARLRERAKLQGMLLDLFHKQEVEY